MNLNENTLILNKKLKDWVNSYPLLEPMMNTEECIWINPKNSSSLEIQPQSFISMDEIKAGEARLKRFAPFIEAAFPSTSGTHGIIESPLKHLKNFMDKHHYDKSVLLKCDNALPISGSIKARGGIYEILKHAESLAKDNNLIDTHKDYSQFHTDRFKEFFSNHSIAVGSTGNLGLSIGIISAELGFKVYVHMSSDAKQWKKDLLRSKGVNVIEYESDYSKAVEQGRKESDKDPNSYFVDDEKSKDLFVGYAVAALRLKSQLEEMNIPVDENHHLYVYLPCGVGGGPGGVAHGLKLLFGDAVHCFFAEPTHSPCVMLGMMTGTHDKVCVQDFGIDNITAADGLAVGRASSLVCDILKNTLDGCCTVGDNRLFQLLSQLYDLEQIKLEPSALAGMAAMMALFDSHKIAIKEKSTHIIWATGGSMVPDDEYESYYDLGHGLNK